MRHLLLLLLAFAFAPDVLAARRPTPIQKDKASPVKRQVVTSFPPASWSAKDRYVIMDNDWYNTAHVPFLIALAGRMKILGLVGDTGDSWALQTSLHALGLLEHGNLSCIPVALGEYYPLMMTQQRFNTWKKLWGQLAWSGVFNPENLTAEAAGSDPSSGNPNRVSKAAFLEGYPNTTFISQSAPEFMVEQVFKYPGQVSIYSAGTLTNIAAAIRMNASFASTAKELVIMGGYVDLNIQQTMSDFDQDLGSDINFTLDPEAAHIAVTADWPSITIAGNVANTIFVNSSYLDSVATAHPNLYSDLTEAYYPGFPLWDETAAMIMAFPEVVNSSIEAWMDVSTAYDSPFLGGTFLWGKDFAPSHTRKVNFVTSVNNTYFMEKLTQALSFPPTCVNGVVTYPS